MTKLDGGFGWAQWLFISPGIEKVKVKGFRKRTLADVNHNAICEKELSDRNTELPESS
jgi:hypothetical protein